MSDFIPTNTQIAELLQKQTYTERMEMAAWFRDMLNDQRAEMTAEEGFGADQIAELFNIWAEAEIAFEEAP